MTPIEERALALWNEVRAEQDLNLFREVERKNEPVVEAPCRALEAHDETKRAFSEASKLAIAEAVRYGDATSRGPAVAQHLEPFIIPDPVDPLAEAIREASLSDADQGDADRLRTALAARGYKIVEAGA